MALILYRLKRTFDVQKAERFFKERRAAAQSVDLSKAPLSYRTLAIIARAVSPDTLIDTDSIAYKECPARFSGNADALLEAAAKDPRMLRAPIIRCGVRATVGYRPDIWQEWLDEL